MTPPRTHFCDITGAEVPERTPEEQARLWAERNSSPGIAGRDETYEMLISVQAQAYEAGHRDGRRSGATWMRERAANLMAPNSTRARAIRALKVEPGEEK